MSELKYSKEQIIDACKEAGLGILECNSLITVLGCCQPEATKPAQDLGAAILAMNRAKLLPIWDNDVPHKLHVELDLIFKALAALASPAEALVAGDSETVKDAALYREIRKWNPKQFTDAWARALSDKIKFDEIVNAAIQAQKDGHAE